MNYRHFSSILVPCIMVFTAATVTAQQNHEKASTNQYNLDQFSAIAWDLHDVVFTRDYAATFSAIFGKKMLAVFAPQYWKQNLQITPVYLKYLVTRTPGDHYYITADAYKHEALKTLIMACMVAQKPIPETVEFLRKNQVNYVASNMGIHAFNALTKKYPEVMGLFVPGRATLVDYANTPTIKKPKIEYFNELVNTISQDQQNPNPSILFIDDKKRNVAGAQAHPNIVGLHFTSPKVLQGLSKGHSVKAQ